ncbi:MAG TPA: hypothetical protein VFX58_12315 [Chitinophagaceae bacterium]|nr:hypothetical protein [Chitinophagaceae bacterium]
MTTAQLFDMGSTCIFVPGLFGSGDSFWQDNSASKPMRTMNFFIFGFDGKVLHQVSIGL